MNSDAKLLAVYDNLLKKIEEISALAEGPEGQPGQDGKDAPDRSKEMFAAIATLHSDLIKEMISMQSPVTVSPEININAPDKRYTVERDSRGFITSIVTSPI